MRNRLFLGIAAVLMTILAGRTQVAPAGEFDSLMTLTAAGGITTVTAQGPGRLAALSARQQLRDEVCIAMADGRISRLERFFILTDARRILKPEEYASFKQSLDRLAPPPPPVVKKQPATAAKKQPATMAHKDATKKSTPAAPQKPSPVATMSSTPTIPTDVVLPDRVVLTSGMR